MVKGQGKVAPAFEMTAITQIRLRLIHNIADCPHAMKAFRSFDRMAGTTGDLVDIVVTPAEVENRMRAGVTAETSCRQKGGWF